MTTEENYTGEVVEIINPNEIEPTGPKGIGGWLIFVIISYTLSILNLSRGSVFLIPELFNSETGMPLYQLVIGLEIMMNLGLLVYVIFITVMLFRTDRNYPKFASVFYIINVGINVVDAFLVSMLIGSFHGPSIVPIGQALLGGLIWFNYFRVSVRVKNTYGTNGLLGK